MLDTQEFKLPIEFFARLPKTDLHVHLDGSLRLETIIDLARQQNVQLPATEPDELKRTLRLGENYGSLVEYLKVFDVTLSVLQTEESLFRTAFELAEDAALENVRYMEVRYSPMLHTRKGLRLTNVIEAVLDGLRAAREKYGIESNIIICGIRNISPESSLEMAELAVAYKNRGVVGFDLAGAEYDYPAKHHRSAFQLVRDNNINTTIHAGEAYGPESIAQAIHVCGAPSHRPRRAPARERRPAALRQRSPHPRSSAAPPRTTRPARSAASLRTPIKLYYNLGLRVTVNTDNRMVTDTTVTKELWLCHTQLGFTLKDIKSVVVAGFKSAFLPFHVKQQYVRRITQELRRFNDDGTVSATSLRWPSNGRAPAPTSWCPPDRIRARPASLPRPAPARNVPSSSPAPLPNSSLPCALTSSKRSVVRSPGVPRSSSSPMVRPTVLPSDPFVPRLARAVAPGF